MLIYYRKKYKQIITLMYIYIENINFHQEKSYKLKDSILQKILIVADKIICIRYNFNLMCIT